MKKIIVGLIFLIGLILTSLSVHVVHLDDSVEVLVKTKMTFTDTYVDARGAKKFELLTKPRLIEAGIQKVLDS
ncbi:hypothetical protein FLL45_08430 [Aliikangiella marina]|uniref:Uncharacterized protein n=1 Tax=Aliikangiella marina TaxID=1712262 RepID=A0A545TCM5_9GAMM|nr:hypothetical protein [Aliikangiella marina]TQV74959.1 hypothetical protein FLL45_08430 [Aliikangiella marina]